MDLAVELDAGQEGVEIGPADVRDPVVFSLVDREFQVVGEQRLESGHLDGLQRFAGEQRPETGLDLDGCSLRLLEQGFELLHLRYDLREGVSQGDEQTVDGVHIDRDDAVADAHRAYVQVIVVHAVTRDVDNFGFLAVRIDGGNVQNHRDGRILGEQSQRGYHADQ